MDTDRTADVVRAYYESWKNGMGSYDEARLRAVLAPDLAFEGPIAGRRTGAEPFLKGIVGFIRALKAVRFVETINAGKEAAVLYDADLIPAGTLRFAEFLRIENSRIQAITLVYDATEYRKHVEGARAATVP